MYKITYSTQAVRAVLKLTKNTAKLIREKLDQLAQDPHGSNPNVKKLLGRPGYRLRVGDWRVIYEINDTDIIIIVMKIGSRGEVYK